MDVIIEEEYLLSSVIPAAVGGKHVLVLPCICPLTECCKVVVRLIYQTVRLDEDRVCKHVHIVLECECAYLRVICSRAAFNDLAVLVPHGSSVHEDSHRVFCIIVQMSGPQGIMIFIGKLHDRTSELRKVQIYHVLKIITCQYCLFLKNAHVSPCIYDLALDIPKRGIADEVCVIVKEAGRAYDLSVTGSFHIHHLGRLGAEEHDKTVLVLLLLVLSRKRKTGHQGRNDK